MSTTSFEENQIDLQTDEQIESPKISYLKRHVQPFNPTDEELEVINESLNFKNGKIAIGGLLYLPTIGIIASIVMSLFALYQMSILISSPLFVEYVSTTMKLVLISIPAIILILSTATLVMFIKRKKTAITLLKIMQIASIIMAIANHNMAPQTPTITNLLAQLIPSALWLVYTFKSKRLKYTMVE